MRRRAFVLGLMAAGVAALGWSLSEQGTGDVSRAAAGPTGPVPVAPPVSQEAVDELGDERTVHRSRTLGRPWAGRLVHGVQLPSEGPLFFTWDPVLNRSPNRGWRRWGSDRLVGTTLRVLAEFKAAHPDAPRLGIGDLSRQRGGDFGRRFGAPGHASHQNGLDVDVYYPRRDRLEREPKSPAQVDRALAQDLVDRFVAAGAQFVFVGLRVSLHGPRKIVQRIPLHDNHLHVRIPRAVTATR